MSQTPHNKWSTSCAPRIGLSVELATTRVDIAESQALRHQVFTQEMGAGSHGQLETGLEQDDFDPYCHHLLVRNNHTGNIVGSTRILLDDRASQAGGFYSETEFDLDGILPLPGKVMEIGRTCIHPGFRSGGAITVLWAGLARFIAIHQVDYLIGCASIPLADGVDQVHKIMEQLREKHLAPSDLRAIPWHPLPPSPATKPVNRPQMPPLLKAYMRLGAHICGEPCLDLEFNTADLFILLDTDNLNPRYQRHFMERSRDKKDETLQHVA